MTKIRGDQLAEALGAYDSWMTFHKLVDGREVNAGGGASNEGESPGVGVEEDSGGGATMGESGGAGIERGFRD